MCLGTQKDVHANIFYSRSVGKLSFEEKPLHNLTIEISDKGHPRLSINIHFIVQIIRVNENRFQPKFSKFAYEAEIYENEAIDSHVIDVLATDQDEKSIISYTLVGGDGIGYFRIDSAVGAIGSPQKPSTIWLAVG
uniref:Cadherin domain-containing protein n=1 Tax=Romanomermis culicivorax TaxID=13658 RepID=A0A915HZ27_ROMCU